MVSSQKDGELMKRKMSVLWVCMILILAGRGYAVDSQASLGTQAGEAARDLKDTANESFSTGAMKVAESSRKVEAEVQSTVKTLQEQWEVLAKQLQEKTKRIQTQVQQQWQDFNKSLNQPPKS